MLQIYRALTYFEIRFTPYGVYRTTPLKVRATPYVS